MCAAIQVVGILFCLGERSSDCLAGMLRRSKRCTVRLKPLRPLIARALVWRFDPTIWARCGRPACTPNGR